MQKIVEREVFVMKSKHQYHLAQLGEYVYGAQSWKKRRLICESIFVQIDGWTLNLKIEREVLPMKWKHQHHLSQWEEYV